MRHKSADCQCAAVFKNEICGMIDAHAHHNSGATCPLPLLYAQIRSALKNVAGPQKWKRTSVEAMITLSFSEGVNIQRLSTAEMGDLLVRSNTAVFEECCSLGVYDRYKALFKIRNDKRSLLKGRAPLPEKLAPHEWKKWKELDGEDKYLCDENRINTKNDVPSLIIIPTMDMEFAHIDGYKGIPIYQENGTEISYRKRLSVSKDRFKKVDVSHERKTEDIIKWEEQTALAEKIILEEDDKLIFQKWRRQIKCTENAAASNPLRLFPLFFYEPRRYRYDRKTDSETAKINNCGYWDAPFERIVTGPTPDKPNIREHSGAWIGFKMYPSLGHKPLDRRCIHLPKFYAECAKKEIPILTHCSPGGMTTHDAEFYKGLDKGEAGGEYLPKSEGVDYFFEAYAHPKNWLPVLDANKDLHLCLAHFGGDEWKDKEMKKWAAGKSKEMPPRDWIRYIVQLTRPDRFKNVYTDISCLDIYNSATRMALEHMLLLIKENEYVFGHLRDKLIFGSDWYLTYLAVGGSAQYSDYLKKFREIFNSADESLWERVSLINPWKCYSLYREGLFDNMLPALAKIERSGYNDTIAEKTLETLKRLKGRVEAKIT